MVWHQISDRPLSESILTQFTDAYIYPVLVGEECNEPASLLTIRPVGYFYCWMVTVLAWWAAGWMCPALETKWVVGARTSHCNSITVHQIKTISLHMPWCTSAVSCRTFCSDHFAGIEMRAKRNLPRNLNADGKPISHGVDIPSAGVPHLNVMRCGSSKILDMIF